LLSRRVKDSGTIGVAFDCDGDRLSFVHPTAGFVGPYVIPPLVLLAVDKYKRDLIKCPVSPKIVKTLPVTMRVNQIARKLGLSVTEVPVGFANVHSTMSGENAMIGLGDDSSVTFPNDRTKDSVLTSLVLLALNNALDLKVTLDKLSREYGQLFHFKNNIRYKDVAKVRSVLKAFPELCGELSCTRTVPFESGIKAFFPQGWILLRVSGTEDSVRIYAESRSKRVLESDVSRINSFVCEKLEASPKHTSYTKLN
jgi:phosphomannomutase/phosphoglucomutase